MSLRLAGAVLLGGGFLGGAYVVVARVNAVSWGPYALCAGAMLAGMVCLRRSQRGASEDHAAHEAGLDQLQRSLELLLTKVHAYTTIGDEEELLQCHHRIDHDLMGDLGDFVEARETMIPRLGMQTYADVMSAFATGERQINRAWSASVDGYVDEVRRCVRDALAHLTQARDLLQQART